MSDDTIGNSLYDLLGDSKIVFNESGDLFVRIPWFGSYRDYYTTAAGTKEDWLSRQQANADGIATVHFSSDRNSASLPQTDSASSTGLDATVVPVQTSNKEKLTGVKLIDTFGINVNNDLAYPGSVQGIGSSRIEPQYLLDPLNAAFTDREYFTEEELRDGVYYDEDTGMYTTYSGVPLLGELEKFKTRERVKEQGKEKLEESSKVGATSPDSFETVIVTGKRIYSWKLFGVEVSTEDIHQFLDWIGLVPGVSIFASGADTIIYFAEGEYSEALIAAVQMIPGAKLLKAGTKFKVVLSGIKGSSKVVEGIADAERAAVQVERRSWRESEQSIGKANPEYEAQKSFKNGQEVPYGTKGSVRPDWFKPGDTIEVKNYDVSIQSGRNRLVDNVSKQVNERIDQLPPGTNQKVAIDVKGQLVSEEDLMKIKDSIIKKTNGNVVVEFIRE